MLPLVVVLIAAVSANPRVLRSASCGIPRLAEQCAGDAACAVESCSQCIMQATVNPFASFCMQLSACTCRVVPDPSCYSATEAYCSR